MTSRPPALTPERRAALVSAGRAAFAGFELETVARTPSTQDRVRERARRGAAAGFCCVAGEQTAGRGRQGRRWAAPPGGALLVSLLLRPEHDLLPLIPLLAGVALADALTTRTGLEVQLKWPNDVLLDGRKLAGLLAEAETGPRTGPVPAAGVSAAPGGTGVAVVLGMGLNLEVESFPEGVEAASLHQAVARPPAWDELLADWLGALAGWLRRCASEGGEVLLDSWRRRAAGIGGLVTVATPSGTLRGVAEGIDAGGALMVRTADGVVRLLAGDVHLVRGAGEPGTA